MASPRAPSPPPRAPPRKAERVDATLAEAYESVSNAPRSRKILVGLAELALLALVVALVWIPRKHDTRPAAVDRIKVARSVRDYRVGDVLYHRGHKWELSLARIVSQPEYEGSILRRYFEAHSGNGTDWSLLKRIVDEWAAEHRVELPAEDEVVVHVRAGDAIVQDRFALNVEGYVQELARLSRTAGRPLEVAIVIAFTYGDYQEERKWVYSEESLHENKQATKAFFDRLRKIPGLEYRIVSHKNPDSDLAFLAHAKTLIARRSGFSNAAREIAAAGAPT